MDITQKELLNVGQDKILKKKLKMNSIILERYRCLSKQCNFKFTDSPKPVECPKCGHKYILWVSFKDWKSVDNEWVKKK